MWFSQWDQRGIALGHASSLGQFARRLQVARRSVLRVARPPAYSPAERKHGAIRTWTARWFSPFPRWTRSVLLGPTPPICSRLSSPVPRWKLAADRGAAQVFQSPLELNGRRVLLPPAHCHRGDPLRTWPV